MTDPDQLTLRERIAQRTHAFAERIWGRFISRLYWRYGRKYDGDSFWSRVVLWHMGEAKVSGRYIVAEMNRIYDQPSQPLTERFSYRVEGWRKGDTMVPFTEEGDE